MKCRNHSQCKGTADGRDGLCSPCREVERQEREEKAVNRKYERDTTNYRSGRYWLGKVGEK